MNKSILLIGDTVSACRVALSAMEPVLLAEGFAVSTLPTAIVSSTFGYKNVAQVSTGDYVAQSLSAFEKDGIDFDSIYVGYVTEKSQADAVADYCRKKSRQGKKIFIDTIMGEEGKLYYGMGEQNRQLYSQLLPFADYALPSYTEAAFIAGKDFTQHPENREEVEKVARYLAELGCRNVIITSCIINGADCTAAYDAGTGKCSFLPCDHIPVKLAGTGDLFAAIFIAEILKGADITSATRTAMDKVREIVAENAGNPDTMRGMAAEKYLGK